MDINKVSSLMTVDMGAAKSKTDNAQKQPVQTQVTARQAPQNPISEDWKLIEKTQAQLANIDDFDAQKVAELRQALQEGRFSLDIEQLSEAILNNHG